MALEAKDVFLNHRDTYCTVHIFRLHLRPSTYPFIHYSIICTVCLKLHPYITHTHPRHTPTMATFGYSPSCPLQQGWPIYCFFAIFEIPHVRSQNTKIYILFSSFSFQLNSAHPTNSTPYPHKFCIIYLSTYSQLHFSLSSTPFYYIPSYSL